MKKRAIQILCLSIIVLLSATACSKKEESGVNTAQEPVKFKVGLVVDTGSINDKGFNENAWNGLLAAKQEYDIEAKYLESKAVADFEKNIIAMIREECDLIVTVGFMLGDATKSAAEQYPEQNFAIVDYAYNPVLPNVMGIVFQTQQAAMLGGYLSAGMSESGKIGTFGGQDIPTVWDWIDGLAAGINYFNEVNGASVELLGADPVNKTGAFVGDWTDKDKGKQLALNEIQEGADVIIPIAGPAGFGAFAAAQEMNVFAMGGDVDQSIAKPEYSDILISSMLKRVDNGVKSVVKMAIDGDFKGGLYVGELSNDGVGLASFHDFEDQVSDKLKSELETLYSDIVAGKVDVAKYIY